ncbi:hypothetical protein BBJ28_00018253 [Nothophytophthora sp. Chile5]|nr:hypothetical protein BBJ28_00018253 [Nothophytophthora sp. Chile5]
MKTQSAALCFGAVALSTLAISPADARPMHDGIDYQRYLEQQSSVQSDLDAWRAQFGEIAQANGLMPVTEDRSADDQEEDLRQRIFLTQQGIKTAQDANPFANFSIMSPFSALTDAEFGTYVRNSYVQGNASRAGSGSSTRQLRGEAGLDSITNLLDGSIDAASLIETIGSLVENIISGMAAGTVQPATDGSTTALSEGAPDGSQAGYQFSDFWNWDWPNQQPTPTPTTSAPPTTQPAATSTPSSTEAAADSAASGSVDWTTSACMAPIQSQGSCGGCWAFATVSAVESAQCIANGETSLTKYSEQQLVSCDTQDWGCNGGAPVYAFEYVQQNGLCTESDYPYTSDSGYASSCSSSCQSSDTGLKGYSQLSGESDLISAIDVHPVVVAVASGNNAWKQYTGGVLSSCDTSELDHAVVAVGYDSSTLKIRNSWGSYWGEEGYIRLARDSSGDGTCGVLTDMSTPQM